MRRIVILNSIYKIRDFSSALSEHVLSALLYSQHHPDIPDFPNLRTLYVEGMQLVNKKN